VTVPPLFFVVAVFRRSRLSYVYEVTFPASSRTD
jgi:hypothetical protein